MPRPIAALLLPFLLAAPAAAQDIPAAAPLDQEALARGVAASTLMDLPLVDAQGRPLGHIRDVLLRAQDRHLAGLIVLRTDEGQGTPTPLTIPWSSVDLGDDVVRVDIPDGVGLDAFAPPAGGDAVPQPGQGWTLGNLVGDYAVLRGGVGFGTVRDVVFDPADGGLVAVVVAPAGRFDTGQPAAYPYRAAAWTPEAGVYSLPYGQGDVAGHPPFDYDSLKGLD